jgi:tripartite-type tricarboxylate transporter receptor subunit TctC
MGERVNGKLVDVFLGVAIAFISALASAQAPYPSKPVRLVVPFAPGGPVDTLARAMGPKLTEALGQTTIVDNRAGAGSIIGTDLVTKAPPDGYTLLVTSSSIAINPAIYPKMPFDATRDLAPISQLSTSALIVVVHPSVPVRSIKELIALARARKGELVYASSGTGSAPHLAVELFTAMTGTKMIHVPHKGAAPATIDLLAGNVALMFNNLISAVPNVQAGKLRALAVTGSTRTAALPELPTVAEAGVPGYEASTWYAMFAPPGTPAAVIERLHKDVAAVVKSPEIRKQLAAVGIEPVGGTPDQLGKYLRSEMVKWGKVAKASGAKAD